MSYACRRPLHTRLVDKVVPHQMKRFRYPKKLDLYLKMSPSHYPYGLIRWHGSQSEVTSHLELTLRRKVWENTTAAQALGRRMETGMRTAGVGAVLERQRQVSQILKEKVCLQILSTFRNDYGCSCTYTHVYVSY